MSAALDLPAGGVFSVCDDRPEIFASYLTALTKSFGFRPPRRLPSLLGKWFFGEVWGYFSRSHRVSNTKLKLASDWHPLAPSAIDGRQRLANSYALDSGGA